jgi:hypothetical protein
LLRPNSPFLASGRRYAAASRAGHQVPHDPTCGTGGLTPYTISYQASSNCLIAKPLNADGSDGSAARGEGHCVRQVTSTVKGSGGALSG